MKFKFFKWSIRVWDLVVFLFLTGYFFYEPFRVLFDKAPYLVKAVAWTGVVLFFYYSIISWYRVIKRSLVNVISSRAFKEAEDRDKPSKHCDFVAGSSSDLEKDEVED